VCVCGVCVLHLVCVCGVCVLHLVCVCGVCVLHLGCVCGVCVLHPCKFRRNRNRKAIQRLKRTVQVCRTVCMWCVYVTLGV